MHVNDETAGRLNGGTVDGWTVDDAEAILRTHKCRATGPRVAVLRALLRHGGPIDAPKLLAGVEYEGDFLKAEKILPAPDLGEGSARRLEVHLHHGKKREIRRLFEAHRYFVKKLVRVQIGGIVLKNIPKGGIKILGKKDIERLFSKK